MTNHYYLEKVFRIVLKFRVPKLFKISSMDYQTRRAIVREQIQQKFPNHFDQMTIDEIVETMASSANCYVIFCEDAAKTITYELKMKGSIKRFGFKNKLMQSLENSERAIFAITINYVGTIDVYEMNENGTEFIRRTVDQLQSASSANTQTSSSSTVAGSSASEESEREPEPIPYRSLPSPTHDPNYMRLKTYYENVYEDLYGRPFPR